MATEVKKALSLGCNPLDWPVGAVLALTVSLVWNALFLLVLLTRP